QLGRTAAQHQLVAHGAHPEVRVDLLEGLHHGLGLEYRDHLDLGPQRQAPEPPQQQDPAPTPPFHLSLLSGSPAHRLCQSGYHHHDPSASLFNDFAPQGQWRHGPERPPWQPASGKDGDRSNNTNKNDYHLLSRKNRSDTIRTPFFEPTSDEA